MRKKTTLVLASLVILLAAIIAVITFEDKKWLVEHKDCTTLSALDESLDDDLYVLSGWEGCSVVAVSLFQEASSHNASTDNANKNNFGFARSVAITVAVRETELELAVAADVLEFSA